MHSCGDDPLQTHPSFLPFRTVEFRCAGVRVKIKRNFSLAHGIRIRYYNSPRGREKRLNPGGAGAGTPGSRKYPIEAEPLWQSEGATDFPRERFGILPYPQLCHLPELVSWNNGTVVKGGPVFQRLLYRPGFFIDYIR